MLEKTSKVVEMTIPRVEYPENSIGYLNQQIADLKTFLRDKDIRYSQLLKQNTAQKLMRAFWLKKINKNRVKIEELEFKLNNLNQRLKKANNENELLKEEAGDDSADRAKYYNNLQELADSL